MKTVATILVLGFILLAATTAAQPPIPDNYRISSYAPELQNEEQIWTCPTDSTVVIAVWRDFRLGYRQVGIGRTYIVNDFWTDSLINPNMQMFMQQSDPCLTVDNDGNFYICVLDYQPSATTMYDSSYLSVLKSTDKGVSWTGPVTVEDTLGPYFEDKQFTVVDRTDGPHSGNYYVAWARFPNPTRIMFVRSIDGAQSFEDTLIVGPTIDGSACGWGEISAGQFACPAVGSDGSVYVMWIGGDLDTTTCDYYSGLKMTKSTDGGASFDDPVLIRNTVGNWGSVDGGVNVYNQPVIATDVWGGAHDGNIYVAYANMDYLNWEYEDYNIELVRSTDGGANWSEPVFINDDFVGLGAMYDQFHPWLICNEEGTLVCLWYDQRTDVVNHFQFDAFAAYSYDGGETFTTNHRISNVSINPSFLKLSGRTTKVPDDPRMEITSGRSPQAGLIAEYIGVTAFNDHINATWTDTRNGNQDVYGSNWTIPFMKPRLISPEDGAAISDPAPTLIWSTSWKEDDDSYRLEVAEDNLFASIVFSDVVVDNQSVYAGPSLVLGEDYFWRVKAFRTSVGDSSEYSDVYSFNFATPSCSATGDVNNDGLPLSVSDLNYLTAFVEGVGPAPPVLYSADMNGDCTIDHLDVAVYEDYFAIGLGAFTNGYPVPTCCEVDTVRGACCLVDTCFTLSPYNCSVNEGGVYEGDGTYCITNPCSCFADGDVNDDGLPLTVADLVYLVEFVEGIGPAPPVLYSGDMNGDCTIDHLDVAVYEDYFAIGLGAFTNGYPVPTCCEVDTVRGACCMADTCFTLSPYNCFVWDGGIYEGDGTYCITNPCSCCIGIRGNVDGDPLDAIDISDLVYLVDYMFNGGPAPPCIEEADIDGGGGSTPIDIADLVYLVDYMFTSGPAPAGCL